MAIEEKRLYPRLTLKVEDGYFVHFLCPDQASLAAPIVNLSAGGINLVVPEATRGPIQEGDALILKQIAGGRSLSFLADIRAEVRWIRPLDGGRHLSVGCKFMDLAEPVRQQLSQFVHSERMSRGQYD